MDAFSAMVQGRAVADTVISEEVRIAVVYPELQQSLYWTRNVVALTARLSERGVPHRILRYASTPQDVELQLRQLREALAEDPDYLLFHLDSPRHQHAVDWLLGRSRPVVLLQNVTSMPAKWRTAPSPLLCAGFDHHVGTAMLAAYFGKHFGRSGKKYAMITTQPGYLTEVRGDYFIRSALDNGLNAPVDRFYVPISHDQGYAAGLELVHRHHDLAFIYAAATDLALGAAQAVHDQGMGGSVMVNGWGGGDDELRAVHDGRLGVTVMRMNDDAGVAQADAIWLHRTGRENLVPKLWSGQFELIEQGMNASMIDAFRRKAFRYSGKMELP